MIATKYGNQVFITEDTGTDEIEKLNRVYGAANVHLRDFYNKGYVVLTRSKETGQLEEHPTSVTFKQESKMSRSELRRSKATLNKEKYGEQKSNSEARTKHMRTARERKLEIARRKQC